MAEPLALSVWLRGEHVADVVRLRNGRNRLRFAESALDRWGVGARPLSYSLPLTERRVSSSALDAWLDNLLPEGGVRSALERQHQVRPGDALGLLAHIGYECAGAVQLVSGDDPPPAGTLRQLSPGEATDVVDALPTLRAPDGLPVSASLGGVQAKVLLTRTDDGWAWPDRGAMSSHIVKPEPTTHDAPIAEIIRYEHWAMRLAAAAGVRAATVELEDFGGRRALVVERFDRDGRGRTHQEDLAQSLGLTAGDKYEPGGAAKGRLATIASTVANEAAEPDAFRRELLEMLAFNLVVGNGDAHAKNYSVAISGEGTYRMAPLYDVAPVYLVSPRFHGFGFSLDGQTSLRHLGLGHLVREAAGWGVEETEAENVVRGVVARVADAAGALATDPMIEPVREDLVARARSMVDG